MDAKEEIELLDSKVTRLKVEYEQYFMRRIKREPTQLRDEVEKLLMAYSNKSIKNTSLKFKYSSIVARYTAYKQYWGRVLRAIEEGTYDRKTDAALAGVNVAGQKTREVIQTPLTFGKEAPAQSREEPRGDGKLTEIYKSYIDAKARCNEPVEGLTFESFAKSIEKSRHKVEELYNTKDIELKVYISEGKAKLAIKPKGK